MSANECILIVDDEVDMRETLRVILERDGYQVVEAENGAQMDGLLAERSIDLVILDWMIPGEDGLELGRKLRTKSSVPFIMVTGRDDVVDKIVGLEVGADDYITKPFHARELTARVHTVLRRARGKGTTEGEATNGDLLHFEEWEFNLGSARLMSPDGEAVPLTTFEFQVLAALARRPNRVLSRDQILDFAAGRNWNPTDRSVDVLIGKLRKKLRDDPKSPTFIRTVRNLGYVFVAAVDG